METLKHLDILLSLLFRGAGSIEKAREMASQVTLSVLLPVGVTIRSHGYLCMYQEHAMGSTVPCWYRSNARLPKTEAAQRGTIEDSTHHNTINV